MHKRQSGFSGTLIIVILLTVALLAALGYIGYTNFIKTDDSSDSISTIDDEDTISSEDDDASATATLEIPEWGVSGVYDTSQGELVYALGQDYIYLHTGAIEAIGSDCTSIRGESGGIARLAPDTTVELGVGVSETTTAEEYYGKGGEQEDAAIYIDGYYYVYSTGNGGCVLDSDAVLAGRDVAQGFFRSLE